MIDDSRAIDPQSRPPSTPATIPRRCTLDGFAAEAGSAGIELVDLDTFATLVVRTRNSVYRLTVLRPGAREVLVQGGRFFPVPTRATFSGSGFGGSCLKLWWVGVGLHLEFVADGRRIITSRVITVVVETAVSASTH